MRDLRNYGVCCYCSVGPRYAARSERRRHAKDPVADRRSSAGLCDVTCGSDDRAGSGGRATHASGNRIRLCHGRWFRASHTRSTDPRTQSRRWLPNTARNAPCGWKGLATPRPEFLSPMLWRRENPSHLQPDHLRVGRSFVCRVVLADHLAGRVCAQRCLEFVIANSPARGRRRDDKSDHGNRPATANVAGEAAQLPTSHELPPAAARTVPNSADRTSAIGERGGADLAFGLTGYVDNLRTDMPKRGRDLPLNS